MIIRPGKLCLSAIGLLLALCPIACQRQPEKPLELGLTLVKTRLKPHDALWYVLQAKNVGHKPFSIHDDFWTDQHVLLLNVRTHMGTRFEILGPNGKPAEFSFMELGDHGEFDFWSNAATSFKSRLNAGDVVRATPSVIARVRQDPRKDWRAGPASVPRGKWMEALKREPMSDAEIDSPEWARVPFGRPTWAPADARILQGFDFEIPGKYRMRAVFDWLSPSTARDIISDPKRLRYMGIPEETRVFHYESPWVEFEVGS